MAKAKKPAAAAAPDAGIGNPAEQQ